MRVIDLPDILTALDESEVLAAIESGFRRYSAGESQVMAVGHLGFDQPPGDCHVKGGHMAGDDVFVVKLATSFYRNADLGLPTSNGFMAVMSAVTGEVLAVLHDQGRLTDIRTALAGAIAARVIARPGSRTLGIVGAGTQARLQAELIARRLGFESVLIWARQAERAASLARDLGTQAEAVSLPELCARADLIVTTTPSTDVLLTDAMVRPGARIVALGADSPGKRELDPALVARGRVIVDSRAQCIDHGEAGWAVRAGLIDASSLVELGELFARPAPFDDGETVIVDLTGVAFQDIEIAKNVWKRLQASRSF